MSTTNSPSVYLQKMGLELDFYHIKRYLDVDRDWQQLDLAVRNQQWENVDHLLCQMESAIYKTTNYDVTGKSFSFRQYQQHRSSFCSSIEFQKTRNQRLVYSPAYSKVTNLSQSLRAQNINTRPATADIHTTGFNKTTYHSQLPLQPQKSDKTTENSYTNRFPSSTPLQPTRVWPPQNNDTRTPNAENSDSSRTLQSVIQELATCVPESETARKLLGQHISNSEAVEVIKNLSEEIKKEFSTLKSSETESARKEQESLQHQTNYTVLMEWVTWFVNSITKESTSQPVSHHELMPETKLCIGTLTSLKEHFTRIVNEYRKNKENIRRFDEDMKALEILKEENQNMKQKMYEMEQATKKLESEKQHWINRVSKVAGTKLTSNNPGITDLSDPNRPVKIAERFGELYDNSWTDALEKLETYGQRGEQENIKTLAILLKGCFEICEDFSMKQKKELKTVLFSVEEHQIQNLDEKEEHLVSKGLSDCRKEASSQILPALKQVVFKRTKQFLPREVDLIAEYISGCVDVCWGMVLQEPNLCFVWPAEGKDEPVNKDLFGQYTRSGKGIEFVVWPAMLLHIKGPLLRKGSIQPFKRNY